MADYNASRLLSLDHAQLGRKADSGLLPDGTLEIRHPNVPVGAVQETILWLQANRTTLDGTTTPFKISHNSFPDKYRLVTVTQTVDERSPETVTVVAGYARIYDTTLDFANARIIAGEDGSEGDKFQSIEFRNLDRDQGPSLLAAERQKTYPTGFTGGAGPAVTGEWVVLAASHRWDEDGSGIIVLHLGAPDWTMTGFRNFGLPNHQEIIWIWNVPKKDAQSVINGYMLEGYSVSAQHSIAGDIPGTVDITVTNNNVTSSAIDVLGIGSSCDVESSTYHRFGLTKSEAMVFADGFKERGDGVTKSVRLGYASRTGKYNGTAIVATRMMDTKNYVSTIANSEKTTTTTYFEWGLSKGGLDAFLQGWAVADPRTTKRLSLNRNADCSFNVVATETLVAKTLTSFLHGTKHAQESFEYHFRCSEAEKDAVLATLANDDTTTGRRDVSVSRAGDDTYQVAISISREKRAEVSFSWSVGTVVNTLEIFFSLDQSEAFSKISSLPEGNTNYRISLSRGGDGTYDLVVRSTTDPGDELSATIGNVASKDLYEFKFGIDNGDVLEAFNALNDDDTRVNKRISLRRNFDGKYDLTTTKSEVKDYWANWPTSVGKNYLETEKRQWGKVAEDIPGLSYQQGTSKLISAGRDGDGNWTFSEKTRTTTPWLGEVFTIGRTKRSRRVAQVFRNAHVVPTLPLGKEGQITVSFNDDDGTYSGMATWYSYITEPPDPEKEFQEVYINYRIENHVWRTGSDGVPYLWRQPIDVAILQTLSLENAKAHVHMGMEGSSIRWTGTGYRAVRMSTTEPVPVNWEPGEPPG